MRRTASEKKSRPGTIVPVRRWAAVAAGVALATVAVAPAQAAPPSAPAGEEHCVVVLDKLRPGESTSRVAAQHCAATPEAAQRKHRAANAGAAAATLLLVLYEDRDYRGASLLLEGGAGACDQPGFGIPDLGSWRNRISSFKLSNSCQHITGYDLSGYRGAVYGPWTKDTPWVGPAADDRIDSLRLRRL